METTVKDRKKDSTLGKGQAARPAYSPREAQELFGDVLTGIRGRRRGWVSAALGSGGVKRRRGRKPTKTKILKEAEKLHEEGLSWPKIARKLTPDAYRENTRNSAEAIRQGVFRLKKQRPAN